MKKYLWMSSVAVVIGAFRVNGFLWAEILHFSFVDCSDLSVTSLINVIHLSGHL